MALDVSLSVFVNTGIGGSQGFSSSSCRLLYRFKDETGGTEWICSYRIVASDIGGASTGHVVPSYLECCGVLLLNDKPDTEIVSMVPDEVTKREFYVFKWDSKADVSSTLQEGISCFRATAKEGSLEYKEEPISDINWIENDVAETKRRGYSLIAATLLIESPLLLEEDVELNQELLGAKELRNIPPPLSSSVGRFFRSELGNILDMSNERLSVELSDIPLTKSSGNVKTHRHSHFSFGSKVGYSMHVMLCNTTDEEEAVESVASVQIAWQTSCIVPTDVVSEEDSESIGEVAALGFRRILSALCRSDDSVDKFKLWLTPQKKDIKRNGKQTSSGKASGKSKGSSKGGKGKGAGNRAKKPQPQASAQATALEILKSAGPIAISIDKSERKVLFDVTLDKSTGDMVVEAHSSSDRLGQDTLESVKLHSILKCFVSDGEVPDPSLPFGGTTMSLLDLVYADESVKSLLLIFHPGNNIKLLIDSSCLCDRNILVEPHPSSPMFPQWMSSKTSRVSLIKGFYQYYHYMQGGINDNGWGCCYRSIQMVASWYLLQYYNVNAVPMHSLIQKYLKERDPSHIEMVIGSPTWIGTVESGYFINWYLNYNTKTFHLTGVDDLRNYNGKLAQHFESLGTPVIMGVGMYAYVLIGICMGANPGDVAYLIADPHYAGEDNIKNIRAKGAIAWKKVDFIAKASNGGFINLCCPQLESYEE